MISARRRSDTRRLILIGLFVSLIIHLFGGAVSEEIARLLNRLFPSPILASLEAPSVRSDIIRFEQPVPTPAPATPRHAPPPPTVVVQPQPAPATIHHELEHVVHNAPRPLPPQTGPADSTIPRRVQPGAPHVTRPYYSSDQLAQMDAAFSQTISNSHQDLASANAAMARPVQTMKHYAMHVNVGIHEGMNPGDGIIEPTKSWRVGDEDYYYVHYEYMYGDGHVEEADVPWPVHYPRNNDPFARGDHRVAIQGPPPGYTPPAGQTLTPILESFFGGPDPYAADHAAAQ